MTTSPVDVPRAAVDVRPRPVVVPDRGAALNGSSGGARLAAPAIGTRRLLRRARTRARVALLAVAALATFVRLWGLDAVGLNSDEIVYVGQGASIAGDTAFTQRFPIFRAHPLLFQSLLSIQHSLHPSDFLARLAAVVFGVASVLLLYAIGRRLYDRSVGLAAAAILALMPYHVVVSRQVLLDGPMVFFLLLGIYALVRYAQSGRDLWLYATSAAVGLSFLTKETAVVNVGVVVLFLALTPAIRVRLRHVAGSAALFGSLMLVFPLAISSSKRQNNGHNFLVWQLVRRPNHTFGFYFQVLPSALGWGVLALAALGAVATRHHRSWREVLLLSWIIVPAAFFELWPVKGYQYLLPLAPAVALVAARGVVGFARWSRARRSDRFAQVATTALVLVVLTSLAVPTWRAIHPSSSGKFLAGSGGLPGGREAGHWIAANVPQGAELLALGPSMANVIEYYGHRQAYGLSVSTNPLHRNPVYVPLDNPDRAIREGQVQYLVWDSYTSGRTSFYTSTLMRYVERYHGRLVHVARARPHDRRSRPVIVVYEVRP